MAAIGESVKKLGLMTETTFARSNMTALGVKPFAETRAEMARLTTAYRELSTSGKASTGELAKALEELRKKNRELYASMSSPPKMATARDTLGLTAHREIAAGIERARQAYQTLASSGRLSMAELAQAKVALGAKIDELRGKTNGWRDSIMEIGVKWAEVAAVLAVPLGAAKQAIEFESAMADVRKVVDGTPEQIQQLGDEIQAMSMKIPLASRELAAIAAAAGQLGIAKNDIPAFTEVVAKMSTAFNMTAGEAGTALGKLKTLFGMSIADMNQFGDAVNQLGNNTASTERDIVEVMLRIGGTAKQFGLAKEEAAALAATFLSLGKPPEIASTAINALLTRMQAAEIQTDAFKSKLQELGWSAEEMATAVEKNPQKAINDLLGALSQLEGRERANALGELFGREYQDDLAILLTGLDEYRQSLGMVADQTQYAGAMQKEFDARAATTANGLTLLKNAVVAIAENVGEGFLPAIKAAGFMLSQLLRPIVAVTEAMPKTSAALVALGAGALVFGTVARAAAIARLALVNFGIGARVAATTTVLAANVAAVGVRAALGPLVIALTAGWEIGTWLNNFEVVKKTGIAMAAGLTTAWLNAKRAWATLTGGDTAAIEREIEQAKRIYTEMFAEVGREAKQTAGRQQQAQEDIAEATTTSAADQKRATGEALAAMQAQYKEYADEIKGLQDSLADHQRSTEEELRDMARSGMSDLAAWRDRKAEAGEFTQKAREAAEAAKQLFAAGNVEAGRETYKVAAEYADKATAAYRDLNEEVKRGDQVVISQGTALRTAMAGVREAGEVKADIIRQQTEALQGAQAALNEQSGGQLDPALDAAKTKVEALGTAAEAAKGKVQDLLNIEPPADGDWGKVWAAMESGAEQSGKSVTTTWDRVWDRFLASGSEDISDLERQLQELSKDRHVTVYIEEKVKKAMGGIVQRFARGGRLPGYGGGDRISALLEAGEFIVRKEAVARYGTGLFNALNSLRLPEIPRFAAGGMVGAAGDSMTINLSFGGGASVPVTSTRDNAILLEREFRRRAQRSSR